MTDSVFMPLAPETRSSITLASAGDRAPLLLMHGQWAKGGNKVQVLRLTISPRVGVPRAILTRNLMMH